jgi:hypothetical protein
MISSMSTSANSRQVAGAHYRSPIQHWDYVWANDLNYFEAQVTKYVTRARKKNGLQDLQKALHFLEKYIELVQDQQGEGPTQAYVNQDPVTKDSGRSA